MFEKDNMIELEARINNCKFGYSSRRLYFLNTDISHPIFSV